MKWIILKSKYQLFRESFRQFVEKEFTSNNDDCELAGIVDRSVTQCFGRYTHMNEYPNLDFGETAASKALMAGR